MYNNRLFYETYNNMREHDLVTVGYTIFLCVKYDEDYILSSYILINYLTLKHIRLLVLQSFYII